MEFGYVILACERNFASQFTNFRVEFSRRHANEARVATF